MKTKSQAENIVRLFGMTTLQIQSRLQQIETEHSVDLGVASESRGERDDLYYPQFSSKIRKDAQSMSQYYEIFYCLERSIRDIIRDKFFSFKGANWWEECVHESVKQNALYSQKKENESGVTPRSDDILDYTTFGELGEIITKNWEVFGDLFTNKLAVQKVLSNLNTLRGPIAHCSLLGENEVLRLQVTVKDWFRLME